MIAGAGADDSGGREAVNERLVDGAAGEAVDDDDAAAGAVYALDLDGGVDGDGGELTMALNEFSGKLGLAVSGLVGFAEKGLDGGAAGIAPSGAEMAAEAEFLFDHAVGEGYFLVWRTGAGRGRVAGEGGVETGSGEMQIRTGGADLFPGFVDLRGSFERQAAEEMGEDIEGRRGDREILNVAGEGGLAKGEGFEEIERADGDDVAGGDAVGASDEALQGMANAARGSVEFDGRGLGARGIGTGDVNFQAVRAADGLGDDGAGAAAAEKLGESVGGLRGGGETDALEGMGGLGLEAFEDEREQGAARGFCEFVELVDDDGFWGEAGGRVALGKERLGGGE